MATRRQNVRTVPLICYEYLNKKFSSVCNSILFAILFYLLIYYFAVIENKY